jgi:hypothetical protein
VQLSQNLWLILPSHLIKNDLEGYSKQSAGGIELDDYWIFRASINIRMELTFFSFHISYNEVK